MPGQFVASMNINVRVNNASASHIKHFSVLSKGLNMKTFARKRRPTWGLCNLLEFHLMVLVLVGPLIKIHSAPSLHGSMKCFPKISQSIYWVLAPLKISLSALKTELIHSIAYLHRELHELALFIRWKGVLTPLTGHISAISTL